MVCCVCKKHPSQLNCQTNLISVKIGEQGEEFGVLVCQDCWNDLWEKAAGRSHGGDDSAIINVDIWWERVSEEFWGNIKQVVLDIFHTEAWSYALAPFYTWSWRE